MLAAPQHRSGPLKQHNKSHKSQKSKNRVKNGNQPIKIGKKIVKLSKADKKNMEKLKRQEKMKNKKLDDKTRGCQDVPPYIISVMFLDEEEQSPIQEWIASNSNYEILDRDITKNSCHFFAKKYNRVFRVNYYRNTHFTGDSLKNIAQTSNLLFVDAPNSQELIHPTFVDMLLLMNSHGLNNILANVDEKQAANCLTELIESGSPISKNEIISMNDAKQFDLLLHKVSQKKIQSKNTELVHPKLLIDHYEYDNEQSILQVSGFVVCNGLSNGCPVYLPTIGHKPILKVEQSAIRKIDPCIEDGMTELSNILYEADCEDIDKQTNIIHSMDFSKEMEAIRNELALQDVENIDDNSRGSFNEVFDVESKATDITGYSKALINDNNYNSDGDDDEEMEDAESEGNEKDIINDDDVICLNPLTDALKKFRFYRGIVKLKDYAWNLDEYLPIEYSQLYRFPDYVHQRRLILEECDKKHTLNKYCTLSVGNISEEEFKKFKELSNPFAVGLLQYEGLPALITITGTIKNKALLHLLQSGMQFTIEYGPITIKTSVIFSEQTFVGKYRYLKHVDSRSKHFSAHFYAPISITPCPVFIFLDGPELLATGSVQSMDADCVIYKRKQLCGKIRSSSTKSVVVQQMFHNRADVDWFMNVPLTTSTGRTGHIISKLGTHGDFKCRFEKKPKDGYVYMNLYKRVFPKYFFEYQNNESYMK
ncbi:MAG: ribosome biogenesis protein tsr1 [Marteilia pararefringens]